MTEKIKVRFNQDQVAEIDQLLSQLSLHTICSAGRCPNMGECFRKKTATFMILGDRCTRNCRFCNVEGGKPRAVDPKEPERLAKAVCAMGLSHVVVTSVTRDDLADGGAGQFAETIRAVRREAPETTIEVLIPDFGGSRRALQAVVDAAPEVINHNLETVPSLYKTARPQAEYLRSLEVLSRVKEMNRQILTKTGIMVGLGESKREVVELMTDARRAGCDILTVGQYLRPTEKHLPVVCQVDMETFDYYKEKALELGFRHAASGPLVRSSYRAAEALEHV